MLDSVLSTVSGATSVTVSELLLCTAASLVLGILSSLVFMFKNHYNKGFVTTIALMPAIVQIIIMLVNGNLGTGVAVMGAFSLVRFRSAAGSAREIAAIFLAMALGLATGMGYLGIAAIFLAVMAAVQLLLAATRFGENGGELRSLKVVIPENLDYAGAFDDIFAAYTKKAELIRVKTTNLGSLYELHYHVALKDASKEKEFLDQIRCKNGNLNITFGRIAVGKEDL